MSEFICDACGVTTDKINLVCDSCKRADENSFAKFRTCIAILERVIKLAIDELHLHNGHVCPAEYYDCVIGDSDECIVDGNCRGKREHDFEVGCWLKHFTQQAERELKESDGDE